MTEKNSTWAVDPYFCSYQDYGNDPPVQIVDDVAEKSNNLSPTEP